MTGNSAAVGGASGVHSPLLLRGLCGTPKFSALSVSMLSSNEVIFDYSKLSCLSIFVCFFMGALRGQR